jgi:hypothetical protein
MMSIGKLGASTIDNMPSGPMHVTVGPIDSSIVVGLREQNVTAKANAELYRRAEREGR